MTWPTSTAEIGPELTSTTVSRLSAGRSNAELRSPSR